MAGRSIFLTWVLPVIAAGALGASAYSILKSAPDRPLVQPAITPPTTPPALPGAGTRQAGMLGAVGLVEAASEQIGISALDGGVVARMFVVPGGKVRAGDALFAIDDRAVLAEQAVRAAALETARAQLDEAIATAGDQRDQLDRAERLMKSSPNLAISDDTLTRRRFAARLAEARVATTRSGLVSAEASLEANRVALARLTVRAPIDATVLQTNIRVGEYAAAGALAAPLVVLGQLTPLHVRVSLDEADVPRFDPAAPAWASPRGAAERRVSLKLVRVDPLVVPKTSLTGAGNERVDTRVLRIVYSFNPSDLPAFPGQQMDVFIDVKGGKP
jgi:RND family efflux transporter MFP subunit